MGVVFRQSVKTTIVIFAGALLGAIVNWGYANALNMQAHGYTRNLLNQASLLQFSVILGTAGTLMTYLPRYELQAKRHVVVTFAAIVPLLACLLLVIPYALFKREIISFYIGTDRALIDKYYYWLPVLTLLWAYMTQLEYYLYTQHKNAVSSFVREVILKLFNIAAIALFYFKLISFTVFIACSVLIYGIPVILLFVIANRTGSFGFSLKWNVFSMKEYKHLIQFSWYHLLEGVSSIIMVLLDSYLLGIFSVNGLKSVSIYAIAIFFVTVVTTPYRAMLSATFPVLNTTYANKDWTKLEDLFRRSAINILIVGIAMAIIIGANIRNALFFLSDDYRMIIVLVPIMMIGRVVDMGTGLNREIISISEYYKQNFRLAVLLVALLLVTNIILIRKYDMYGAAWGTTISIVLFNAAKAAFLYRKFKLQPFSKHTLSVLLAGAVAAIAGYCLPALPNVFLDVFVRTGLIVVLYGAILIWLKPSPDLTVYLKSIRENKRLF